MTHKAVSGCLERTPKFTATSCRRSWTLRPRPYLLVVTDPPDPLADIARETRPGATVLSAGTYLDSQRFRVHLGKHFSVDPAHVEAQVIGDHGTAQVFLWSSARVGGVPIATLLKKRGENLKDLRERIEKEVRYANITIIEGHNASQYGIGIVSVRIAEMVLKDERAVIPIGSFHKKLGVTLSLPSVVGRGGIIDVLEPELSDEEQVGLGRTAPKSSRPRSREFTINDLCSKGCIGAGSCITGLAQHLGSQAALLFGLLWVTARSPLQEAGQSGFS